MEASRGIDVIFSRRMFCELLITLNTFESSVHSCSCASREVSLAPSPLWHNTVVEFKQRGKISSHDSHPG